MARLGQRNGPSWIFLRAETEHWRALDFWRLERNRLDATRFLLEARGTEARRRRIEDALPYHGSRTTFVIDPDGVHCRSTSAPSGAQTEEIQDVKLGSCDRRILFLVGEDEYLIAMSLQDALESVGSWVVARFRPSTRRSRQSTGFPDLTPAVSRCELGGELAYSVAYIFVARKIPFRLYLGL